MKKKIIMALDCGDRWIGVAIGDEETKIALPHSTWELSQINNNISEYLKEYLILKIIIGLPLTFKNKESEQTKKIIVLKESLEKDFPLIAFTYINERLTSKGVNSLFNYHNHKMKKTNNITEHSRAASLLLEMYFQKIN